MSFQEIAQRWGKPVFTAKHSHVFRQGDADTNIYLLESGLLKAYYLSEGGKESIKSFILPGNTIASLAAGYKEEPCSFNVVALQDSQLLQLSFEHLSKAAEDSHAVALSMIDILMHLSMKKEQREYELLSLSAPERYQQLLASSPGLLESVTQNDIARYLGITPVALSRIKKRGERELKVKSG